MAVKKPKRKKPVKRAKPAKKRPVRARKPLRGAAPAGSVGYVRKTCPLCNKSYCVPPSQTKCPLGHTFSITDWPAC